jgi:hypothetical protein
MEIAIDELLSLRAVYVAPTLPHKETPNVIGYVLAALDDQS